MDISLCIASIRMKISMHIPETHLEGSLSQIFDNGFSFCFRLWYVEEVNLKKNHKIHKSYPFFIIK